MPEDKSALIKTAYSYYQKGDWDRAIEEYHKLAEMDAKDLNVHNMLADIYAKKGDVKEALQQYDLVAQGFDQKNQVDKVLQVYKRMLKLMPNDTQLLEAVKNLIERYMDKAAQAEEIEPDKAADIYRSILKAEPTRLDVTIQLAKLLMKKGQKFEAIELLMNLASLLDPATQTGKLVDLLQTVAAWDPTHIEAREKLTELLMEAKQNEAAISSLQGLVEIYIGRNELDKAEKTAQRSIQLGDVETYYHLGVIFFNQQKFEEARAAFEKFLSKQETHVGALKYLAMAYTRLGQVPQAVAVYLKILNVYFSENLLDEARDIQHTILEMDPDNGDVKQYAVGLNPPQAEEAPPEEAPEPAAPPEDAAPAADDEEATRQAMLAQAGSFAEKGLYEQAIDVYLDMLKRWPEWPEIRARLQQAYALMARAAEPVDKGPSPEEIKAELERELKAQMRRELDEQSRRLQEEQTRLTQERHFEAEMKRELEQMRLKQELESKLLEQVQRTKEEELRQRIAKEFEEKQRLLAEERDRLEKEKLDSINRMKDELEQTKQSYEQKIRQQVEREMQEKLRAETSEKERQEKEGLRQVQLQAALQKEEMERSRFEEQKKVQEAARAKVDQEISQGMERLRLEKEREKKAQPTAAPPSIPAAPPAPSVGKPAVTPAAPGGDSLEDPFIRQTLADIYAKQGLFVEALKIYERILNEDPENQDVKDKLRNILKMKGI